MDCNKRLKALGQKYYSEEQLEFFQFGPGEPIRSTKRWHYPVGVQGVERELVISEAPAECPGLVGPSELSACQMKLEFEAKTFTSAGRTTPIIYARSGHPCMCFLEYKWELSTTVYQLEVAEDSEEDMPPLVETSDEDRGTLVDDADSGLEALLEKTRAKTEYFDIAGDDEEEEDQDSESSQESPHAWTLEPGSSAEATDE